MTNINKTHKNYTRLNTDGDETNINAVCTLMPMWCDNIADNMKYIQNGSLSSLVCKTYPNCWKSRILIDMFSSKREYILKEITDKCKLSISGIEHIINSYPSKVLPIAGTKECIGCENYIQANKPAIIIGNGPSLTKYNHLEVLKKYGFKGDIFCVSSALKKVLDAGIIPTYVNSLDAEEHDVKFIDYDIVRKNTDKMIGIFGISVHPKTNELFNGKKYFYGGYIENSIIPNVSHILYLLTKTPQVNTGGNVGSANIAIASVLGYNPIILIGMDLSFPTFEEMKHYYDTIIHTWEMGPKNYQWNEKTYKKETNPDFNKEYYCDLTYGSYKVAALKMIKKLVEDDKVKIINCTEAGCLHSKHIKSMKFIEYLNNQ